MQLKATKKRQCITTGWRLLIVTIPKTIAKIGPKTKTKTKTKKS